MSVAHRTYAKALFEAAEEKGRLAKVREELADFVAAIDDVPELDAMLRNPQIDPRAKASMLDDILGGADELVRNFLLIVTEKNRGGQLRDIHKEFERLMAAEERRLTVDLTTAYELSMRVDASVRGRIERLRRELTTAR
jgi:F-type H+-transporting ATPase subunit delta